MDEVIFQRTLHAHLKRLYLFVCHDQTKPDGKNCQICGDNDHQAFECRFNAFNLFRKEKL